MKQKLIYLISAIFLFSCSSDDDIGNKKPEKQFDDKGSMRGDYKMTEKEATEVLLNFLKGDGSNSLKSSNSPLKILRCKETNSGAYANGNAQKTLKNGQNDESIPLYEFVISEKENEYGFALVSGDKRLSEVLAYAPNGNIADTLYNEGLAGFMRSLSAITTMSIGNEYWQPQDVPGITFTVPGSVQFLKYATEQEYWDWPFYDNWDYWEHPCAFVPVKWDQGHPYNMYAPIPNQPYNHCTQKSRIGCGAVALGQLMAYHKKPNNYDWNTLTRTLQITSSSSSYAQKEVGQLMINLATALEMKFNCKKDGSTSGGTNLLKTINCLRNNGYSFDLLPPSKKISSDTIYSNIIKNMPVLCSLDENKEFGHAGHIVVIDGLYRKYRNKYSFSKDISDPNNKIFEIYRMRECFACTHINWGWGGSSDGWYYNFSPYGTQYSWLGINRTLITNIRYTGQ